MGLQKPILVTGATGYVGGRLIPRLLSAGYRVRAMGRSVTAMSDRPWASVKEVELVRGDVLDAETLLGACRGCEAAYYLVHSMVARKRRFAEADRRGALNMRGAAEKAGLRRLIYLGGLGDRSHPLLSHHLASRHEVGDILASGSVPVITLRAAMILGSGSASFEILRHLVDRLPVMITPRWVESPTQPIAVSNVLDYLVGSLRIEPEGRATFDIGGPDVVNYRRLIEIYAEEAGLPRRRILPVPVLTPRLSAAWIDWVTPIPAAIARPLTEGLSVPTVCSENRIRQLIPASLTSCREAIHQALREDLDPTAVCLPDGISERTPEWSACGDAAYAGATRFSMHYRIRVRAAPERIWPWIERIGDANGYYFAQVLWRLRGYLDCLAGGPGLKRGRCENARLRTGDAVDFWRVGVMRPLRELQLESEMRAPGRAMLAFELEPRGAESELRLNAYFRPRGLGGMLYWISFLPVHAWLFRGLLRSLARRSGDPAPGAVKGFSAAERGPRRA